MNAGYEVQTHADGCFCQLCVPDFIEIGYTVPASDSAARAKLLTESIHRLGELLRDGRLLNELNAMPA
jgi:hypothetical protein